MEVELQLVFLIVFSRLRFYNIELTFDLSEILFMYKP